MGIAVSPQIHPQVAEFIDKPRKMLTGLAFCGPVADRCVDYVTSNFVRWNSLFTGKVTLP